MSSNSKYVNAAFQVLDELGGGPISSRALIDAIVDKGLLEHREYLYHNVLTKVRESDLFDTSQRGSVSLVPQVEGNEDNTQNIVAETLETEDAFEAEEAPTAVTLDVPGVDPIA